MPDDKNPLIRPRATTRSWAWSVHAPRSKALSGRKPRRWWPTHSYSRGRSSTSWPGWRHAGGCRTAGP